MAVPPTDSKARISLLVFRQRAIHPIIEITCEIDWKRKIGQNAVRLVRPSRKVRRRKTTVMFGERLLGGHNVVCRCHVFRHSFQLWLIVEWIGLISSEL